MILAAAGRRGLLAGYLFFCGTLAPVLGFFNVYPFVFSYVADHFQYLASLGIIVPVAGALTIASRELEPPFRRVLTVSSAFIVVVLAVLTWERSAFYRDAETLFRDTVARNPQAWMAYQNLGTELAARNRMSEAIEAFEGALKARPGYVDARNNLVLAHMKLGETLIDQPGRSPEAVTHYEAVLRLDPDHFRANYNLGTILMDLPERHAEAITLLEHAVRLQPESVEANVNLGLTLSETPSRVSDAIAHLEKAVAKRPELPVRQLLDQLRAEIAQ